MCVLGKVGRTETCVRVGGRESEDRCPWQCVHMYLGAVGRTGECRMVGWIGDHMHMCVSM